MTDSVIVSGQSEVSISRGNFYKKFNSYEEYFQEKWFLTFIKNQGFDFIPEVVSFDDTDLCIVTKNAGKQLDSISWQENRLHWCKRISETINDLWVENWSVPDKYTKVGDIGYRYVADFLKKECPLVMRKTNVPTELIKESVEWITESISFVSQKSGSIPSVIHFDLSPRNVLIDGDKIKIIDWSRSMFSELALDIAIMKEKFGIIGEGNSFLLETKVANLNMELVDRLANCFSIYRKAKKVTTDDQRLSYIEKVRAIISS